MSGVTAESVPAPRPAGDGAVIRAACPVADTEEAADYSKLGEDHFCGAVGVRTSVNVHGKPFARITVQTEQHGIFFPTTWPAARLIAGAKTVWLQSQPLSASRVQSRSLERSGPILKERAFGLTPAEGNHCEDVKEYYFYVDNTMHC